ncbi:hypoxia-inducible factor 1-alpha-like [Maniola jurtina]|uniref:hypoxia-inducible factor 1-alpha-like n=1 Tax=Maniola jurtina TaxID=191418 RepID=UPI001E689176|nr:hypoxia-inducible factor 1-alpha-like [Maniola jurtina]
MPISMHSTPLSTMQCSNYISSKIKNSHRSVVYIGGAARGVSERALRPAMHAAALVLGQPRGDMSERSALAASRCPSRPAPRAQPPPPAMEQPATPPPRPKPTPKPDNPRELRNKAEKQRRDTMNQSVSRLAAIVPPVATATKKVDKTSVLRLTAHYLRAHKHVFGKSINRGARFSAGFTRSFLRSVKGFVLTATYKGLVVVVSPNVQEFLGYTELELLGQSLYSIVHPEDYLLLKEQLFPRCCRFTSNGELFLSREPDAEKKAAEALKHEKRAFIVRFKKLSHVRSEPVKFLTCHVEGSFRKSDDAGVYVNNSVQTGRRVRSRGNNPYASGNDIVFVGVVRPITETFATESRLESFRMEYRTRHSIDGSIIQCEQRISLITGYMIHEVHGVNAMNFMHRDDVRWVVVALREMYVNHHLMGESCYRLMTKNGEFIHMRTSGALEVDPASKEASSFVCTNTVVPEQEGLQLIKEMKQKFSFKIQNEDEDDIITRNPQVDENQCLPVEDPRQLEQVIYNLVTDLPSPLSLENVPKQSEASGLDLAIIPPKREQIKKAIEKSYTVIKTLRHSETKSQTENMNKDHSPPSSAQSSPEVTSTTSEMLETHFEAMEQQIFQEINGNTEVPGHRPTNWDQDYSWLYTPSSSGYNPADHSDHEEQNMNIYGDAGLQYTPLYDYNAAARSYDPDAAHDGASTSQHLSVYTSFDFQTEMAEYTNTSISRDNSVKKKSTEVFKSRHSTTTLQLNMSKKSEPGNYGEMPRNYHLRRPPPLTDVMPMDFATNLENGSDLWSPALPRFEGLPEDSSSTFVQTDNFSYLSMDRSVETNIPDFDLSPTMDCLICGSFFDEEQVLAQAEGAPHAIDDTSIDEIVRAAEAEHFEMFPDFDQETDFLLLPEFTAREEMELTVCDVTEQNAAQAAAEDDPYEFRAEDNMPI